MKYVGLNYYRLKDMANVEVFADKESDKRTGQKLYGPNLSMMGHNKVSIQVSLREVCRMTILFTDAL